VSVRFYSIIVNALDPKSLAQWWASALGWSVTFEASDEYDIAAGQDADGRDLEPIITFVPVTEPKSGPNRLHIDLAPDDQDAEVERLIELGARHTDVGQSAAEGVTWVVLADPEGNEFCVLSAR
jgi:predicted enzyme related to lactoylglutathione lyase